MKAGFRRTWVLGVVLAMGVGLAACDSSDDPPSLTSDPPPTEASTTTSAMEPPPDDTETTTTPPPDLSAGEQDQADITATVVTFVERVQMDVLGDDSVDIESIYPWVVPPARDEAIGQIQSYRYEDYTVVGSRTLDVLDVDVDGDQATVEACLDVAELDVVDGSGESVVGVGPDKTVVDLVLIRSDERSEFGWQISELNPLGELCES